MNPLRTLHRIVRPSGRHRAPRPAPSGFPALEPPPTPSLFMPHYDPDGEPTHTGILPPAQWPTPQPEPDAAVAAYRRCGTSWARCSTDDHEDGEDAPETPAGQDTAEDTSNNAPSSPVSSPSIPIAS